MSDSEDSTVTYTAVSIPFGGLSDIGSPEVVGPEHEGLSWMLDDPYVYSESDLRRPKEDDDEDPKEDPVDYLADGGDDGDDEDEPSDDDEDEEVDIEAPSAKETEPFKTDESYSSVGLSSCDDPAESRGCIYFPFTTITTTHHTLHTDQTTHILRTPPLHLLSTDHRADRPEVTLPPRKRLGIALGPRYEVGESSSAAAARPAGGLRADYGFVATMDREIRRDLERDVGYGITDSWDEIVEAMQGTPIVTDMAEFSQRMTEFETMIRQDTDEIYTRLIEAEARMSREAWGRSMDASDLARAEVMSLRTTVLAQQSETEVVHRGNEAAEETSDSDDSVRETSGTRQSLLSITENGTKQTPDQQRPEKPNTTSVTNAQLQAMIDQGITAALAAHDANRNVNNNHTLGTGVGRTERTARECTYTDFLKCQPLNFKGTEGVAGLSQWFERMESVFHISNCTVENQVKFATCTLHSVALIWMFPEEYDKIEKYVSGLPDIIHGSVVASKPKIKQDAGHFKRECPKLKNNNNRGNQVGGGNAPSKVYAVGHAGTNPDSNVMTDLMPVELGSFDAIIGMDWLVKYQAIIVCAEKIVRIPWGNETLIVHGDGSNQGHEARLHIISYTKTQEYMLKGCPVFLANVNTKETEDKSEKKRLEDVPIIQDFPDVFPEDLSGLPPTRQVEFQIDLIPGAAPVAWAPID
ncbi:putative reverse transcriptase domain-containing protein [Tanacetum coccineum]